MSTGKSLNRSNQSRKHRPLTFAALLCFFVVSVSFWGSSAYATAFVDCAGEGGTCYIPPFQRDMLTTIQYSTSNPTLGEDDTVKYYFISGLDSIPCSHLVMGDPAHGKIKSCRSGDHNPMGIPLTGYSYLCSEGQTCYVPGGSDLSLVRYGTGGKYVYYFVQPGETFTCNVYKSDYDPYHGQLKQCWITGYDVGDEIIADNPYFAEDGSYTYGEFNYCAGQDQNCNTGNTDLPVFIRYGVGDRWVTHVAQGHELECSVRYFDFDPASGQHKYCWYRKVPPTVSGDSFFGEWVPLMARAPSPGIGHSFSEQVSYGLTTEVSESSSREFTTTLGAQIEYQQNSLPGVPSTNVTFSIEQSFTKSTTFTESTSKSLDYLTSQGCDSEPGYGLYVWQFNITGNMERCLKGTNECSFRSRLSSIICSSSNQLPDCLIGASNCQTP